MNYKITYKKIKNGWVRLLQDMTLAITIPLKKAHDKAFEKLLIEKWRILMQKHQKREIIKIIPFIENDVVIFGARVPKESISGDINTYLKNIVLNESKIFLDTCSQKLSIPYAKLSVKPLKSKWWSCSANQNISINQELVHLDKKYLEYVCIHEACHLKEKNHSKNFWKLVESYFPDYKNVRKELKKVRI